MSFGQQWLNDWEDEKEAKSIRVDPVPLPVPLREVVLTEVTRYLAMGLAEELTERILIHVTGKQT